MKELNKNNKSNVHTEKLIYTVIELMAQGDITQKYLLGQILPQIGCSLLVGEPDTGKSQFAKQLCIHVASGDQEFLGFKLKPSNDKAIYIATEDDMQSFKYSTSKQFKGLDKDYNDNFKLGFADTLDQKDIIKLLENELAKDPAGLVVIDSFGDVFIGKDSNNNMDMRNTVKRFDKIGKKYGSAILFVHHINKMGYGAPPGQKHIQGGSGLAQKVRSAIQLSHGDGNIRYLTVVKGNYCPKKFKDNSIELTFSEETFLFSPTGRQIVSAQIGNSAQSQKNSKKFNEKIKTMGAIMGDDNYRYTDLVELYCEKAEVSESTAKRVIDSLTKQEALTKNDDGFYSFNKKPGESN